LVFGSKSLSYFINTISELLRSIPPLLGDQKKFSLREFGLPNVMFNQTPRELEEEELKCSISDKPDLQLV
jgi:hypothetical protein